MKPSNFIFAFLLGGISVSVLLGAAPLAILLAMFLLLLILVSLLARAFRQKPGRAHSTGVSMRKDNVQPN
jgi:membrane protein implicated in regulation of membrane protease activity